MPKHLYLVRHCESSGQAGDSPLTQAGFAQAEALASFLSGLGVELLVSSTYTRAHQSIQPLSSRLGRDIQLDPRLIERKLSAEPIQDWRAAIDHILAQPQSVSVVATHGNMMTLILRSFDPAFGFNTWERLSNPDVFSLVQHGTDVAISRVWKPDRGSSQING